MTDDLNRNRLIEALEPLPTSSGGKAIVIATAGTPPAMALLSTGDVNIEGDRVSAVTYRGSSVSQRLEGSFTLLVPASAMALRVEVIDATTRSAGRLEVVEGRLLKIRPTAEPPWLLEMSFTPDAPHDSRISAFVDYWAKARSWLALGASGEPPTPAV